MRDEAQVKRGFTLAGILAALLPMATATLAQTTPAPPPTPPPPAPLSLAAATSTALQQLSTFRQAEIDEAIAAEDLRQARAALLPRFRDSFTATYNSAAHPPADPSSPSFIAQNALHEYQNLLGFAGDLDFGMLAAIRHSRALLDVARAGTDVARRALIRGVNEAYFGAALATAKRSAAETSLAAAQEFERVTCLNFDAGEVPEVDCIRARLQTAQRRDDLAQAREAEAVAGAQLGTLLGLGISTPPSIEPLPQTIDTSDLSSFTQAGISQRPEVRQLEAQLRAARADVGVARGAFLPKITYSIDKGFDTPSLASAELKQHRGTLATANVDVPIFDWGITWSKFKQARLRERGAELQRELATRDLNLQFLTAREEAASAAARVDNAREALADAERNVTISVARYRAGEAPILEATDAQATLAQQRLALQQALFDYQVAHAHLQEAAGR